MRKSIKITLGVVALLLVVALFYLAPSEERNAQARAFLKTKQTEFGIPEDVEPTGVYRVNPLKPNSYWAEYAWEDKTEVKMPNVIGDGPDEFLTGNITFPARRSVIFDAVSGEYAVIISEN